MSGNVILAGQVDRSRLLATQGSVNSLLGVLPDLDEHTVPEPGVIADRAYVELLRRYVAIICVGGSRIVGVSLAARPLLPQS